MIRALHVEVGGTYGGSLRALQAYLAFSDPQRLSHDLLLYYPTPQVERLRPFVNRMWTLRLEAPTWTRAHAQLPRGWLRSKLDSSSVARFLHKRQLGVRILRDIPTAVNLSRLFRSNAYDIIHVNNTFVYQAATLVGARIAGLPVVAHVRNPLAGTFAARRMAKLVSVMATVNPVLTRQIKSWSVGVNVRTCYDSVEVPRTDASELAALQSTLGPAGGLLIGSLGRLEEQKGYEYLVRAARRVVDARPNVRFAIAGEGPLRSHLVGLIRELNLTEHFCLCGFRTDIASFLKMLDIFVCSSLWEGGPLTVAEALLMDKPVVSTAVGFVPELIVGRYAGHFVVPPGDVQALATAVTKAVDKPDWVGALTEEGRKRVAALTDPRVNAQIMDDLLVRVSRRDR